MLYTLQCSLDCLKFGSLGASSIPSESTCFTFHASNDVEYVSLALILLVKVVFRISRIQSVRTNNNIYRFVSQYFMQNRALLSTQLYCILIRREHVFQVFILAMRIKKHSQKLPLTLCRRCIALTHPSAENENENKTRTLVVGINDD